MNIVHVTPAELTPAAASELWPDMVPVAGIVIIAGLTKDGGHSLHVLHDNDSSSWAHIGMLRSVEADMLAAWVDQRYHIDIEFDDEEGDQ